MDWIESWGNPSSIHWAGRGPKALIRNARRNLAQMIGCEPLEIVFTSGGSEANNLAIKGLLPVHPRGERKRILISAVEHPSVFKTAHAMTARGYQVDLIPVNRDGRMDLERLDQLLSEKTALVSVMLANNETGHLFPVREIAKKAHEAGALVHCDAVQALGKIPVDVRELGVDAASFSGHKFYSLKGAGALYVRRGMNLESLIHGGGQERGRRAGTENTLSIAALGFMCARWEKVGLEADRLTRLRDEMESRILREIPDVTISGRDGNRLPNTSNMNISGVDGETLLMNLDVQGFAVSTGAACSSGNPEPSPVLLAMGFTRAEAQSSLRLSLGWGNTQEDIDRFVEALKNIVTRLRGFRSSESQVHYV